MSTIWAFHNIVNKHSLYCAENCIKKFCISLRAHAADLINFEKKKMLPLKEKELKSHQDATGCYISRQKYTKTCSRYKSSKSWRPLPFY